MLLNDCLLNAVGKQPSIPLIDLGRKWSLRWWWWWWWWWWWSLISTTLSSFQQHIHHSAISTTSSYQQHHIHHSAISTTSSYQQHHIHHCAILTLVMTWCNPWLTCLVMRDWDPPAAYDMVETEVRRDWRAEFLVLRTKGVEFPSVQSPGTHKHWYFQKTFENSPY